MNAEAKSRILTLNGYEYTQTTSGLHTWWFDGMAIAESESRLKAADLALEHHKANKQEALTQAANDAAGEAAYNEVVEELRQQLADAQAENARLKAGLKLLVQTMDEKLRKTCNWHDYERARNQANDIFVVVDHARTLKPVPVADAPATPARMRVKWGERGFSSGAYEVISTNAAKQAYVLNISTDASKPMPKLVKMADCQPVN